MGRGFHSAARRIFKHTESERFQQCQSDLNDLDISIQGFVSDPMTLLVALESQYYWSAYFPIIIIMQLLNK